MKKTVKVFYTCFCIFIISSSSSSSGSIYISSRKIIGTKKKILAKEVRHYKSRKETAILFCNKYFARR